MADLMSAAHNGPWIAALLVDGIGTLGFAGLIALALYRASKKDTEAREADASAHEKGELSVGDRILFGGVEYAKDTQTAVRVEIDQFGEESESSGVWSFKWTETNRRVLVAPFYLRLNSGERVRVEPSTHVFLVDAMDGLVRVDLTHRIRRAELSPSEMIYASGTLTRALDPEGAPAGGYRSGRENYVLRPPRGGNMLLSSEPLGARFHERAGFHRYYAFVFACAAIVFHIAFLGYHVRRYAGVRTTATIHKLDHTVSKDSDGDDVHHYVVWLDAKGGGRFSDDVNSGTFLSLREGEVVPVTYVSSRGPFSRTSTIGPDQTVSVFAWFVAPLFLGAWAIYNSREKSTRPWYERHVVDSGKGRLEDSLETDQNSQNRA